MYNKVFLTQSSQDVNWTYIRRSEDIQDVFWTSYMRSVYVLCRLGSETYFFLHIHNHLPHSHDGSDTCHEHMSREYHILHRYPLG